MKQNSSYVPRWEACPKNDRLKRWCVVDAAAPGRGKPVIADNIRTEKNARLIAATVTMRGFIDSITDALGPYPELDGTQIVIDARAALPEATLEPQLRVPDSPAVHTQWCGRWPRVKTGESVLDIDVHASSKDGES